jgi:intracellular septation protein
MTQSNTKKYPFILELIPLVLFFLLSKYYNIYVATASLMITSFINLIISYFYVKKIETMPLLTVIFALVFGSLTLLLQDDSFIKIKVTIMNVIFALALFVGIIIRKNFLKLIMSNHLTLEDKGWKILNIIWILFFVFLAVVNEIIWRNFSTDTWINFKAFGIIGLTLVFSIVQVPIFTKYKK